MEPIKRPKRRRQKPFKDALKKRFPDHSGDFSHDDLSQTFLAAIKQKQEEMLSEVTKKDERAVDAKIDAIVARIKKDEPVAEDDYGRPDLEELRIRQAIVIAYLKTSGELDAQVDKAKQAAKSEPEPTKEPPAPAADHAGHASITAPPSSASTEPNFSALLAQYGLQRGDFSSAITLNDTGEKTAPTSPAYTPNALPTTSPECGVA